jgi:hypothetical protein
MSRTSRSLQFIRTNAVASVALFVALGGSAYAADTVFSTDIVDGEVKSVDVEDNGLTGTDVASLGGADVTNESLSGADVSGLTGADISGLGGVDVTNESLTGADVSGLTGADVSGLTGSDVDSNSLTGADIDEDSLSVSGMGCQTGKILGFARIKGAAGIPTSYVDEDAFVDITNNCAGERVEVRRASTGVYFVRFVDNPAALAVGVPNQDGASSEFSGDADNVITIGKITSGDDAGAFRVDVNDLPGPDSTAGGRQDGKFTILLP